MINILIKISFTGSSVAYSDFSGAQFLNISSSKLVSSQHLLFANSLKPVKSCTNPEILQITGISQRKPNWEATCPYRYYFTVCINPHPISRCKSFLKRIETDFFFKSKKNIKKPSEFLKEGKKFRNLVPVFAEWWKPELFLCPGSWNNIGKDLQGQADWQRWMTWLSERSS